MFKHCLFCHKPFRANERLEHLPLGERIAYDPLRGRLWTICSACRRWTLAPIEARWEALEELERLTTDRGRVLARTEHIALIRADALQIVRVGRAELAEEAWWRYGRELVGRYARQQKLAVAGVVLAAAAATGQLVYGVAGLTGLVNIYTLAPEFMRAYRFRGSGWEGEARCPSCPGVLRKITVQEARTLLVVPGADGVEVRARCRRCGTRNPEAGYRIPAADQERLLRTALAYHNYQGASEKRVIEATRLLENDYWPRNLTRPLGYGVDRAPLHRIRPTARVALEIGINREAEQALLELEAHELETRWREEEEIAAIVDGELTPIREPLRPLS